MSENENSTPDADETPPAEAASETCCGSSGAGESACSEKPRRNFVVEATAAAVGAVVGIVPAVIGGLFFLDPLVRKGEQKDDEGTGGNTADRVVKEDGFIRLSLGIDALPADGTPVRYTVHDDMVNAWNMFPNQPIGAVWLRRIQDQVLAFSTVCPHLGCDVEHRSGEGDFFCPCHTSAFDMDGKPLNAIPPRAMDTLETKIADDRIWVKYEQYRGATSEKELV
ncbi:MAG: menaquinol-cytochrome c reductase iron-sulfur subunit [Planctomycetaceae bacterium]|jgi:menaquinol-cytochrome c reductase iron-sulfur subunit